MPKPMETQVEPLDPARTALVLIDLQSRIVTLPTEPRAGDDVVAVASRLADAFLERGALVVLVRSERPGVESQPPGSELVPELAKKPGAVTVVKRTIGGFHRTELDATLRAAGTTTVVLCGISTNLGVESTARAASDHDYELVFVEDGMSALTAAEHAAAVERNFPRLGTVCSSAEVLSALQQSAFR